MKNRTNYSIKIQPVPLRCSFSTLGPVEDKPPLLSRDDEESRDANSQLPRCECCHARKNTLCCFFKENISYFFARNERTFSGFLCFGCMTRLFFEFTLKTLFGTWWGIVGALLGPAIIGNNIIEYAKNSLRFIKEKR